MKKPIITLIALWVLTPLCARVIEVPLEFETILDAVSEAATGDTILLSPGVYEENVAIEKEVCIASHFILSGDEAYIETTIVDGQTIAVFEINGPAGGASSLIGLTIRNGEDGILAKAPFHLKNCIVTSCRDGIDYKTGGGGTVCDNIVTGNLDDGIDLDGTLGNIRIERNIISDNSNDGIEIRLHTHQGEMANCYISDNLIFNNREDGIQFIDYADTSDRFYLVEGNLIYNNTMAGIGLMDEGETDEDYRAAAIPEPIFLFNNTIVNNEYGLTGGGNLVSANNLFLESRASGIKGLTGNSILTHCLFHGNGSDLEDVDITSSQIIFEDPLLNNAFIPLEGSLCIDGGTALITRDSDTLLYLSTEEYHGNAPDIGGIEYDEPATGMSIKKHGQILVYPNPFKDYLRVRFPAEVLPSPDIVFEILDARGNTMACFIEKGEGIILNTSHFSPGVYFLRQVNIKNCSVCVIKTL